MASPWKFLARLTSRRREWKEPRDGLIGDTKPEEATNAGSTEVATDNSGARLVAGVPQHADQPDAVLTVREHSAEASSGVQGNVDVGSAKLVDAADRALFDDRVFTVNPTHDALTFSFSKTGPSTKQKRSQKARAIKPIEAIPQLPANLPTFYDEVQSLDEEIKLLRNRLVRGLQLQNEQLRMMLGRFEH